VNVNMIGKRGIESALSACPAPAAAAVPAVPAHMRPRSVAPGYARLLGAVTPFQGTGLPVAGRIVVDVPTMFVQPHPGDTARRPPA
jgi:hypothetical protein